MTSKSPLASSVSAPGLSCRMTTKRPSLMLANGELPTAPLVTPTPSSNDGTKPSEEAGTSSLHEEMLQQLRRIGSLQLGCALGLTLPATGLAVLGAFGFGGAVVNGLVAALACASLMLQLALVTRQQRHTDENRILEALRNQPPELIPVDTAQPPLLQVRPHSFSPSLPRSTARRAHGVVACPPTALRPADGRLTAASPSCSSLRAVCVRRPSPC